MKKSEAPKPSSTPDKTVKVRRNTAEEEDRLVKEFLPLVHYAVAEMAAKLPRHVSRDDLVSAGMAGLAQAARNFDESRGISFDRYASTRIRGALLDELRNCDWASRSVRAKARTMQGASEALTAKLGRTPTDAELATHLGVEVASVQALNDDVHRAVVLNYDSLITDGTAGELLPSDKRSPDSVLLDRERRSYLYDAVETLPDRLKRVVVGYFFEERPMQELADELGVSESRISQMRAEALELMKDGLNEHLEPEANEPEKDPSTQRVAKRKAAYYAAIAANSDFRTRLSVQNNGGFGTVHDEQDELTRTSTVA
jgi:RNA polymerase sigma factor for flagellar operon FliA